MYKIYLLPSLFIFSVLFSCGTTTNTTYVNPHAEPHIQMHQELRDEENQKVIQDISGKYSGFIPCSDCEHISYVIELHNDLTYNLLYTYVGKSETNIEKSGKFILSNRLTIQLDNAANGMNLLKKIPEGLLLLDKNGNEFSGEQAEQYKLLSVKINTEKYKSLKQQFLVKKWNSSIGFYAFGNEPSWSLDINFDKSMHLKNLDGLNFYAAVEKPEKVMDANITRYRTITESGEIITQLSETKCTDNMSGDVYNYQVNVNYKSNNDSDYQVFNGCGDFVPHPKLNDEWVIIEVENIRIDPSKFNNEIPRLSLNFDEKNIFGHDGCNSFRGSFKLKKETIVFGPMASTMMACVDNADISNKITSVLSNNNLIYKFEENHLVLIKNDKIIMRLKQKK